MAKIIQIVVEPGTDSFPATLYALTDEGKIYRVDEPEGLDDNSPEGSRWRAVPLPAVNVGQAKIG